MHHQICLLVFKKVEFKTLFFPELDACFLFKAQMNDWNVNPSPLDGAVVGMREGGTSLYADVNKNSHFQPVCALTDHSKHYAQHRGRTTLDYSTEIIFRRAWRADDLHLQVFHH